MSVGDTVKVSVNLNVRNGPGTNYPEITDPDYPGTARAGTVGKVIGGPQNANSYTWWKVDFGPGLYSGWVVKDGLQRTTPAKPQNATSVPPPPAASPQQAPNNNAVQADLGKQTTLDTIERKIRALPSPQEYEYLYRPTPGVRGAIADVAISTKDLLSPRRRNEYDQWYLIAGDYKVRAEVQLIRARRAANGGDLKTAERYIKESDRLVSICRAAFEASIATYGANVEQTAYYAKVVYETSKAAAWGVSRLIPVPCAAEVTDRLFQATDFAITSSESGLSEASKQLAVDILAELASKAVLSAGSGVNDLAANWSSKNKSDLAKSVRTLSMDPTFIRPAIQRIAEETTQRLSEEAIGTLLSRIAEQVEAIPEAGGTTILTTPQEPTTSPTSDVNTAPSVNSRGIAGQAVDYPVTTPAHHKNAFDKAGLRGYCTWYVAERWLWARDTVTKADHVEFKGQGRVWDPREDLPSTGPACKWLEDAERTHLLHVDYAKPVKGSIAVFGTTSNNSAGHVAYVESVDEKAGTFYITEMNGGANLDPKTLKTEYFNKITAGFPKIGATTYKGMKVLGFIYPPDYAFDGSQGIPDQAPALDKPGEPAPKAVAESEPQRQPQSLQEQGQEKLLYGLIEELKDQHPQVRQTAAAKLGETKDARAVTPLIDVMNGKFPYSGPLQNVVRTTGGDMYYVRQAAAKSLGEIKDPRAVEPLVDVMQDADYRLREEAARSLGNIQDPRAVEPLMLAVKNDEYRPVREAAIRALGEVRDPRPVNLLISALKGEITAPSAPFDKLDDPAAIALSKIGQPAAGPLIAVFATAHKEKDLGTQLLAEKALRRIEDGRAVEPLVSALNDEDWKVREVAADVLGGLKNDRAVEPLIAALTDNHPNVRGSVEEALRSITGQDFRNDQMKWKQWWEKEAKQTPQAKSSELPAWVFQPLTHTSSRYSPQYPRRLKSPASEIGAASKELVYLLSEQGNEFKVRQLIDQLTFSRKLIIAEMEAGLKEELETLRPEEAEELKNDLVGIVEQSGEIISLANPERASVQDNLERIKRIQSQIDQTSRKVIHILE